MTPENILIFTNSGSVLTLYWSIFMLMLRLIKIMFHLYFSDFFADLYSSLKRVMSYTKNYDDYISHSVPDLKCIIAFFVN